MAAPTASELELHRQRALRLFREGERFLLTGHVRPDGDCLGAQAALVRLLQSLGKHAEILNTDPPGEQFDYLSREVPFGVWAGGELPEHDVVVLLDFSELQRCGPLAEPIRAAASSKLVVDHHVQDAPAWWDAAYVDVRASATGLLVRRIAAELGAEVDRVAALGVMTSIVTDTGWFKYSNTDAETLAIASEMVGLGVRPSELYGSIYQRSRPDQPRAIGSVLGSLEYFADGRLAVVDLPLSAPGEPELDDGDEVLDVLRAVESVEVVLFLRAQRDGTVKLSARSKGEFDVNQLARLFGGGGHAKASGATLPGPVQRAKELLVAAAVEALGGSDARPSGEGGAAIGGEAVAL